MQDKIIDAIAAYLEKNCNGYGEFIHMKNYPECWDVHVATEIAAAIAPLVDAGSGTGKCKGCIKNEGELLHACPYLEWRDYDEETACNCCEQCKQDCKDRIGEL